MHVAIWRHRCAAGMHAALDQARFWEDLTSSSALPACIHPPYAASQDDTVWLVPPPAPPALVARLLPTKARQSAMTAPSAFTPPPLAVSGVLSQTNEQTNEQMRARMHVALHAYPCTISRCNIKRSFSSPGFCHPMLQPRLALPPLTAPLSAPPGLPLLRSALSAPSPMPPGSLPAPHAHPASMLLPRAQRSAR